MASALINVPARAKRGDIIEVDVAYHGDRLPPYRCR